MKEPTNDRQLARTCVLRINHQTEDASERNNVRIYKNGIGDVFREEIGGEKKQLTR